MQHFSVPMQVCLVLLHLGRYIAQRNMPLLDACNVLIMPMQLLCHLYLETIYTLG